MAEDDSKAVKFSYDPLKYYIENHFTACLEDGNLEINADEKNALKSCFSEDHIQIFYFLDEQNKKVNPGSNNIIGEKTDKKKLKFKIQNNEGLKEIIEKDNNCEKLVQPEESEPEESEPEESNAPLITGIVFGTLAVLAIVGVIVFIIVFPGCIFFPKIPIFPRSKSENPYH